MELEDSKAELENSTDNVTTEPHSTISPPPVLENFMQATHEAMYKIMMDDPNQSWFYGPYKTL
ncbi:MAG: hypothetical protein NTY51_00395 [Deltaproteobacteria bacterium]|jgi:hypothetical protein|nr:hypothetical protein [Deltaproteobacteria bacterium]